MTMQYKYDIFYGNAGKGKHVSDGYNCDIFYWTEDNGVYDIIPVDNSIRGYETKQEAIDSVTSVYPNATLGIDYTIKKT